MKRIHATCVAFDGQAVLLRGQSGCGKSDLALRLMDDGWDLVSDDYTELTCKDEILYAGPPDALAGLIEVRAIGLVKLEHVSHVPVVAVFDLSLEADLERLPLPTTESFEGLDVPLYRLHALHASAAAKVRMALKAQNESLIFSLEA